MEDHKFIDNVTVECANGTSKIEATHCEKCPKMHWDVSECTLSPTVPHNEICLYLSTGTKIFLEVYKE